MLIVAVLSARELTIAVISVNGSDIGHGKRARIDLRRTLETSFTTTSLQPADCRFRSTEFFQRVSKKEDALRDDYNNDPLANRITGKISANENRVDVGRRWPEVEDSRTTFQRRLLSPSLISQSERWNLI